MQVATATGVLDQVGPLTRAVYDFVAAQGKVIAAGVTSPSDWDPVAEFIEPDEFEARRRLPRGVQLV